MQAYFGAIRSAPSSRMTSPFSMGFSMICRARAAYSEGLPRREGKGTAAPSESCTSCGSPSSIGVEKMPGAMVQTLIPRRANSRDGKRHGRHPAFRGRIGRLPDLPVEGCDRGGVDDDAALAILVGVLLGHGISGKAQHVEAADQVDGDSSREGLKAMRTLASDDLLASGDACAIHQAVEAPESVKRVVDGGQAVLGLGDIGAEEAGVRAKLCGLRLACRGVDVEDCDLAALIDHHLRDSRPKPRAATRYPKNPILDLHDTLPFYRQG